MAISEYAFSVDDFQNPKVFKDSEATAVLLTRLLLLEPGTYQSHPDMGVGLMSKYRYSVEGHTSELQSDFQHQIEKYLPALQGIRVSVREKDYKYYIYAEFENTLYGISFDKETAEIDVKTTNISDL